MMSAALSGHIPVRSCVTCRSATAKSGLVRIVRLPDGEVVLDASGKKPGRGAYVCRAKECLAQAIKRNKLSRALKCQVPERVIEELESFVVEHNVEK